MAVTAITYSLKGLQPDEDALTVVLVDAQLGTDNASGMARRIINYNKAIEKCRVVGINSSSLDPFLDPAAFDFAQAFAQRAEKESADIVVCDADALKTFAQAGLLLPLSQDDDLLGTYSIPAKGIITQSGRPLFLFWDMEKDYYIGILKNCNNLKQAELLFKSFVNEQTAITYK